MNYKKRVIFITIHAVPNYGSVLQTYATDYILRQSGAEVQILDYIPKRVTYRGFLRRQLSRWWRIPLIPLSSLSFVFSRRIYQGFLKRHCRLSPPYYCLDDIKRNIPLADVYVTGSDQVWNSICNGGIDEMYFFSYLPAGSRIISFASSFGREELPVQEQYAVRKFLHRYNRLSVRERSAKALLENMGFANVEWLLDPTLLLDKDIWYRQLIRHRVIKHPYLVVYTPYDAASKEVIYRTARKIARVRRLKIITFSSVLPELRADRSLSFAGPVTFLSVMYYADCVVTTSFHGTAFSINFNRQFWVYEPVRFSTRLNSILELTGLRHRVLQDVISDEMIGRDIDYSEPNRILHAERRKSHDFLLQALK